MLKIVKRFIQRSEREVKYLLVGVITTLIGLLVYYSLTFLFLDSSNALQLQSANALSWTASVFFAYIANRVIVFRSKSERVLEELFRFFCTRLSTLLIDMGIMFFLVTIGNLNDILAKFISTAAVIVMNYFLSRKFVF